jgi:hypothetical protein
MKKRAVTLSLIAALGLVGLAQIAVADAPDGADPVRYLQLNEFADCYVVNVRKPQNLAYGDIPFYPAIFSGSQGKGKITVGWTLDGLNQLLTVFRHDGFVEELWLYTPGSGFSLISTATWSLASSCSAADSPRPRQFQ